MIKRRGWPDHCIDSLEVGCQDDYTFNEIFQLCKIFDWTKNKFVKKYSNDEIALRHGKTLAGLVLAEFLQQLCGWKNFGICRKRFTKRRGLPDSNALKYDSHRDLLILQKPTHFDMCSAVKGWFSYFTNFHPDQNCCSVCTDIAKQNTILYSRAKFVMNFHNVTDSNALKRVRPMRPHVMHTKMDLDAIRITHQGIVTNFLPEIESEIELLSQLEGKTKCFLVNQLHPNSKIYENIVEGNPYPRKRESFSFYHPQQDDFVQLINRHFRSICRHLLYLDQNVSGYKRWHHLFQLSQPLVVTERESVDAYNNLHPENVTLIPADIPISQDDFKLCACVPAKAKFDVHAGINFDNSCVSGMLVVAKNTLSHCYPSEVVISKNKTSLFNDRDVNQFLLASLRRPVLRTSYPVPKTTDKYCHFNPKKFSSFPAVNRTLMMSQVIDHRPKKPPISQSAAIPDDLQIQFENAVTNNLASDGASPETSFLHVIGNPSVYDAYDIQEYYDENRDDILDNDIDPISTTSNYCPSECENISQIMKGNYTGFQYDGSRQFVFTKSRISALSDDCLDKEVWSPMFNYSSLIHGSGSFRGANCYNKNHQSTWWHNLFRGTLESWGIPSFQNLVQGDIGFEAKYDNHIPYTHFLPSFAKFRHGFVHTDQKVHKIPLNLGNTLMQNRSLNTLTVTQSNHLMFSDELISTYYDMYSSSHLQTSTISNRDIQISHHNVTKSPSHYFSDLVKSTARDTPDCEELNSHVLGYQLDSNIFPIYSKLDMSVRHSVMKSLSGILVSTCHNWRIRKRDLDNNGYINPNHSNCNAMKFYNYHYWFQLCQTTIVSDIRCKMPFYQVDIDDVVDTLTRQLKLVIFHFSILFPIFLL